MSGPRAGGETEALVRAMATPSETDILDLIKSRRAVRQFREGRIDREVLARLVEAGQWAPSGSGREPCVFVVVDDPDRIDTLRAFAPGIIGRPAAVIAVCIDASRRAPGDTDVIMPAMDAAMAVQNILLAATAMGIGSGPVLSFDAPSVSRLLGLPAYVRLQLLIALGYAVGPLPGGRRRPLPEVLHWNCFGDTGAATPGDAIVSPDAAALGDGREGRGDERELTQEPAGGLTPAVAGPAHGAESSSPRAAGVAGPAPAETREMLQVVAFMLSAAKLLFREPKEYGPYRLIDAASRLAGALENAGLAGATISAARAEIEEEKYYGLNTERDITDLLDRLLPMIQDGMVR